jgi:hypothetical protein
MITEHFAWRAQRIATEAKAGEVRGRAGRGGTLAGRRAGPCQLSEETALAVEPGHCWLAGAPPYRHPGGSYQAFESRTPTTGHWRAR